MLVPVQNNQKSNKKPSRSQTRHDSAKAFQQFFRYVPLRRSDEALHQIDRAMAAVRIQSTIRGSLDRSRFKSFRQSLSHMTTNSSSFQLGSFISDNIGTILNVQSHEYPNIPVEGNLPMAKSYPTSRRGSVGETQSINGQRAQELMDDIFNSQDPIQIGAVSGIDTSGPTKKSEFHESIYGNIRIETAASKRRNSWERVNEINVKLSPEGLKWVMKLYDCGQYERAFAKLDEFCDDVSYWRDILLSDVLLLRVECLLAMSDYRRSLSALEQLLETPIAKDIIGKMNETETTVTMHAPEDEIERTSRVFRCMGRLSTMKGNYSNAEKEYNKGLTLILSNQTSSPRRGLRALAMSIRCALVSLYIAQGNMIAAWQEVLSLRQQKFVTAADKSDECNLCAQMIYTLAMWDHKAGNYADAEHGYHLAMQIQRETLDVDHPATVAVMTACAQLKCERNEFEEAEQLIKKSLGVVARIQAKQVIREENAATLPTRTPVHLDTHQLPDYSVLWNTLGISLVHMPTIDALQTLLVFCEIAVAKGNLLLSQTCADYCLRKSVMLFSNELMTPMPANVATQKESTVEPVQTMQTTASAPLSAAISISALTDLPNGMLKCPLVGRAHALFGIVEKLNGRITTSVEHLERALVIIRACAQEFIDTNIDYLNCMAFLAQTELQAGNLDVSSQWLLDVIDGRAAISAALGIEFNVGELHYWRVWLAKSYVYLGRLDEAQSLLGQAGREVCSHLGNNNLRSADAMVVLAELCTARGRYADATLLYQRALRITSILVGERHPQIWTITDSMAQNYRFPGYFHDAAECATQSLNARIRLFGSKNLYTALSLHTRAQILRDLFFLDEAASAYALSLRLIRDAIGNERNAWFALGVGNMGECLRRHGKLDAALRVLRKGIGLRRQCFGEYSIAVAESFLDMILLDIDLGDIENMENGLVMLKEAVLPQITELVGPRHPLTVYVKANAGIAANLIVLALRQARKEKLLIESQESIASMESKGLPDDRKTTDLAQGIIGSVSTTSSSGLPPSKLLFKLPPSRSPFAGSLEENGSNGEDDIDTKSILSEAQTVSAMAAGHAVIEHALKYFESYDQLAFSHLHPWVLMIGDFAENAEVDFGIGESDLEGSASFAKGSIDSFAPDFGSSMSQVSSNEVSAVLDPADPAAMKPAMKKSIKQAKGKLSQKNEKRARSTKNAYSKESGTLAMNDADNQSVRVVSDVNDLY